MTAAGRLQHNGRSGAQHNAANNSNSPRVGRVLSPQQVLELAQKVVSENFPGKLDHVVLAALALIESGGQTHFTDHNEETGSPRVGICPMSPATALWLSAERTAASFGAPTKADLLLPERSVYYCAAYLLVLLCYNGEPRSEQFAVRAWRKGPKSWQQGDSALFWERFVRAKALLSKLQDALDVARAGSATGPVMHVVRPGETLGRIAQVCGVSVDAILAANAPDIPSASFVQPNDCIAIPVPHILPRIYVLQPGDTLSSVAKAAGVSVLRLLSSNPELRDSSWLQPGCLLQLPGLRSTTVVDDSAADEEGRAVLARDQLADQPLYILS